MKGIQAYEFTVHGTGTFPHDMLRYDQCWPKYEGDAGYFEYRRMNRFDEITGERIPDPVRSIRLVGLREPTERRWESFGWRVDNFKRSFVLEAETIKQQ
jgi:hypothetical protein